MKPIKLALNGKEINLTSDDININSTNFKVDKNGNMTCSNANITDGTIILGSPLATEGNSVFKIYSDNNGEYTEIYPNSYSINNGFGYESGGFDYVFLGIAEGEGKFPVYSLVADDGSETKGSAGGVNYWGPGGSGGTYVGYDKIRTPVLTQTSKVEEKKNFEKLENALDIVKATDIYKYNLKNEEDTTKKHIGFVIGDGYNYSKEITSENNDGVDIYSMVSVCMKAIQEQQKQIEILKQEIKELKGEK